MKAFYVITSSPCAVFIQSVLLLARIRFDSGHCTGWGENIIQLYWDSLSQGRDSPLKANWSIYFPNKRRGVA